MKKAFRRIALLGALVVVVLGAKMAFAAIVTEGTILAGFSTAKVCHSVGCVTPAPGVINFRPTNGVPVTVSNTTGLSGNAWGNELGWIDFKPLGGGVSLDPGTGVFSGKAWSQTAGWINFSPTGQQVSVNNAGEFQGWAWTGGAGGGWIKFDCADPGACVKTDWGQDSGGPQDPGGGSGGSNPDDICPNIFGTQLIIPAGYVINAYKDCVLPTQCSELDGALKQPIDVVLVVDSSGSVRGAPLLDSKTSATALVNSLAPGSDRVAYVTYAASASRVTGFNDSFNTTKAGIAATTASNLGGTNIGGALKAAQDEIRANGRPGVKHMIILMGDGVPTTTNEIGVSPANSSSNNANIAKVGGTTIYTVGFGQSVASNFMKTIASDPSYYYYAATGQDLTNIYINITSIECSSGASAVGDNVIYDANGNGQVNGGEVGLPNSQVSLISKDSSHPTRTVLTGSDGRFIFRDVAPGLYSVCNTPPIGMTQTAPIPNACYDITVIKGLDVIGTRFLATGTIPPVSCTTNPTDPDCVPTTGPGDICPNIAGTQNIIPAGYVINAHKDCVLPEQCSALDGDLKQPIDIVLVVDSSGSVRGAPLAQSKDSSTALVNSLVAGSDRVAYVTYSGTVSLVTGFNASFTTTKSGIAATTASNLGGTNIGGALKAAQDEIRANGRPGVKHIIIMMGDGVPTTTNEVGVNPTVSSRNNANIAKVDGTLIYTVGFGQSVGTNFMKTIASVPSYYYYAATGQDLTNIYLQIVSLGCTSASSAVSDTVIHDKNANGVVNAGEIGLPNSQVSLINKDTQQPTRTAVTGSDGTFIFRNVVAGMYSLCNTPPVGMYQTLPAGNACYDITVIQGLSVQNVPFLVAGTIPPVSCTTNPTDQSCISGGDVCPNILGNQSGIPSGMQLSANGNCIPLPDANVGFIQVNGYTCSSQPSLTRAVNGPSATGTFTVPSGCVPVSGAEFGAVFMPGVSNGAGGYPYSNGEGRFDVLGLTNTSGVLLKGGMSSEGRYNVAETYGGGYQIPSMYQYGFMCYGDQSTYTDNLDYTFVPKGGVTHCVSYRAQDLCPNIGGIQYTVPGGAYITAQGDCITPTNPTDVCPNIAGDQNTIPNGKILNNAGDCVDIVIPDACPNIDGYQGSVPTDRMYDANGNCVLIGTVDMCPNIADVQSVVPTGMVLGTGGNCVPLPGTDVGALKITNYMCSSAPSLTRAIHGPNALGAFTAPASCTELPDAEFGAVFMPGVSNGAGPYPYSNGEHRYDVLGVTDSRGELLVNGLSSLGRYNVAETYGGGTMLPHAKQYGLYCYGSTGPGGDNFDYTFVPKNGSTYCVGYRAADLCPNIAGEQHTVPSGAIVTVEGDCITPPNPTDLCPNIAGPQASIPIGLFLNNAGECVALTTADACPNIDGNQSSVPTDRMIDVDGNCVLVNDTDLCPNIAGTQTLLPSGISLDVMGNCVQTPLSDMCPNLLGVQTGVPPAMVVDQSGACVIDPENPNGDICNNIPGRQSSVPENFVIDETGACNPAPWVSDVCPNIAGTQMSLPAGMTYATDGSCIAIGPDVVTQIKKVVDDITDGIDRALESLGKPVTNLLVGLGVSLPIASLLVSFLLGNPLSLADIPLLLARGWSSFLVAIGWKKRRKPWGTVYDSVTKRPIDPAYVVLRDMNGVEIASAITDINGRYGFAVDPGIYSITVNKTNYAFPSTKLAGKSKDDLYEDLYFGGNVVVEREGAIITKNIPLDQLAFDWNEYAKMQHEGWLGKRLEFYRKGSVALHKLSDIIFVIGFVFSVYVITKDQHWYNIVIVALYVVMALMRYVSPRFNEKGSILSHASGKTLPFSIVRVVSVATDIEVGHKVADRLGNYYGLMQNGTYKIVIDKKTGEQTYEKNPLPYPIVVTKGYFKDTFKV